MIKMRKEQLQRYKRYLLQYLRHLSLKKLINLLRVEIKLKTNNSNLKNLYPYFLIVEVSNGCNLKCPLCQMGQRQHIPRQNLMTTSKYREFITPLKDYLFQVLLYDWGEPFLNRDVYEIIETNRELNIGTVISSNLNLKVDAERLVKSGLEHLTISADGHIQEIYSKYRVGGDLEKVLNNLRNIVAEKRKQNSKLPYIEWQCLVTKHTENHLDEIKNLALKEGADTVRFANLNFYSSQKDKSDMNNWLPTSSQYRSFEQHEKPKGKRLPCFWLWRSAVINTNGGLTPCCLYDIEDWSNSFEGSFIDQWRNGVHDEARKRSGKNPVHKNSLICDRCNADFIFKK